MGQVLEPQRHYDADDSEGNGMRACFASIQGWRQTQEDDHTVCCAVPGHKELAFLAVFDGHGGSTVSQIAAKRVLQSFAELLPHGTKPTDTAVLATSLEAAIMKTDVALEGGEGAGRHRFMHEGCTCIMCVVSPTHIVCANVGDSRAILVTIKGGDGAAPSVRMDALSEDQKPNNEQEERRINDAGLTVVDCGGIHRVNGDLAVARALGDFAFKNPDLAPEKQAVTCAPEIRIKERSTSSADAQVLCLACDGIWDVIDNKDCAKFLCAQLAEHQEIYTAAAALVDRCLDHGSRDNMSVLLADLNSKFKLGERPVWVPPEEPDEEGGGGVGVQGNRGAIPVAGGAVTATPVALPATGSEGGQGASGN